MEKRRVEKMFKNTAESLMISASGGKKHDEILL